MDSYDLIEYLIKRNKKTVTRSELEKVTGLYRAEDLFDCLKLLVNEQMLTPIPKYLTNGNQRYMIFNKYHVRLPEKQKDDGDVLTQIKSLHPMMIANGYLLNHAEAFTEFHDPLTAVSVFLFNSQGQIQPISRKERSFELFGEEKFLEKGDNGRFTTLLDNIGIGKQELVFYDTPDRCFPDYIPIRKDSMTILICENKDIWFNIRRIMFEDQVMTVFGKGIDGVLLGNGNQATEKNKLTDYTAFLGAGNVTYLYWGDIDREGLDIYKKVCKANPKLKIELFTTGYEKMIDLAQGRKIPDSQDRREHKGYEEVLNCFEASYAAQIQRYLEENKRLPQEIVSYMVLKSEINKMVTVR